MADALGATRAQAFRRRATHASAARPDEPGAGGGIHARKPSSHTLRPTFEPTRLVFIAGLSCHVAAGLFGVATVVA